MERNNNGGPFSPAGEEERAGSPPDGVPARASVPPSHYAFSTRDIPVKDRFEAWRDLSFRVAEVEVSSPSPGGFDGDLEMWQAGPLAIVGCLVQRSLYDRTARLAANGSDDFSFTLCDHSFIVNGDTRVQSGGGFFLAHDRRFTVQTSDDCYSSLLKIDRAALLELMPRDFEAAAQAFLPGSRVLKLLANMVPLITNKTEPTTPERRTMIGQHIIDLVALLLNPSRDGRALIAGRGLRAAQLGAVLQAIERQFARPDASAEMVGRSVGISARHVHRVLAETTKTFYEHLLERRLLHAREMLLDPLLGQTSIAEIAFQAGFASPTFFGQSFRRRFGDTPTGARAAAATERSLRLLRETLGTP